MKSVVISIALVFAGTPCRAESDIYFITPAADATVSFESITHVGLAVHRLEVRRLAYVAQRSKEPRNTESSCVIYYAGDEIGPILLRMIDHCDSPLVQKTNWNVIDIYYTGAASTRWHQRWKLLGSTAMLEKEERIHSSDDPRSKNRPNKSLEPTPGSVTPRATKGNPK
jgi:hypothetical protein